MTDPYDKWTVQPHGAIEKVDDGILTVEGTVPMPLGNFPRRMTVVRLASGGTLIWSPIALNEPAMATIEAMGSPTMLVVPNQGHRLDIKPWKTRYPAARVVAPPGAKEAVMELVPVAATDGSTDDDAIRLGRVAGTKADEFFMTVRRSERVTLVLNDILANVQHPDGLGANVMARLFGFGVNGPRISRLVRRMFVKDPGALAGQFREWAAIPGLARIIVSHGDPIDMDPAAVLLSVAEGLE